ncbi:MAG TPA: MFS transporter, partial [Actinomycetota bacterium]|nr:MFS transporter [Actinomycetota bacterium]
MPSSREPLFTSSFALVTAASLAYFISLGTLLPIIPRFIEGPLHGNSASVGFGVGSFGLFAFLIRPMAGRLADTRGRKLMMVGGSAMVAVATLGYLAVGHLVALIPLRLLAGTGEAMFFTGAASAVNDLAPEGRRGEALSLFSLSLYLGLAVGPLIGEGALGTARFDRVWLVAAIAAIAASLLSLLFADQHSTVNVIKTRLIQTAAIGPGIVVAASVLGFAAMGAFLPLLALDLGLEGSRFLFLIYSAVVIVIRSAGARIPDAFGTRRTVIVSLAISALGLAVLSGARSSTWLFAGVPLFAAGQALAFPALMSMAVQRAPSTQRGAVIGTFTAFVDLAFGVGPILLGLVASAAGHGTGGYRAT